MSDIYILLVLFLSCSGVVVEILMIIVPEKLDTFGKNLKAAHNSFMEFSRFLNDSFNLVLMILMSLKFMCFIYLISSGFLRFQVYALVMLIVPELSRYLKWEKIDLINIVSVINLILFLDIIRLIVRSLYFV
jgi:hypothetical protein